MSKDKRLKIFDITRDGKGISKDRELKEAGLKRFFVTFKDNFSKMVYVNIFFVLGNFPLFFLIATLSGYTKLDAIIPSSDLFQNLGAIFTAGSATPSSMLLYSLEGLGSSILVNSTLTYVFYGISALALFTFGPINVGTAYILRNIAMGEPVFVWSDFWYAVKRNWKQALPFGIIDGIIICVLGFNIYTTLTAGDFLTSMMFWANVVLVMLYFSMRCYIYVQMLTFKLSVFKILKNSLIFSLLGLKRNLLALLGNALLILFELAFLFGLGGILLPLAVALPLAIMFAAMAYMKVFAAYFRIKEIMIDPYKDENGDVGNGDAGEEEIIMHDDVTAAQRLAEAKRRNGITE